MGDVTLAQVEHGTGIEWTHLPGTKGETWNPLVGCSKVSEGCRHCYAMTMAARIANAGKARERKQGVGSTTERQQAYMQAVKWDGDKALPQWSNKVITLGDDALTEPMRMKAPRTFFVNSMSDLFHPDVPFEFIAAVYGVMAACECTWGKPLPSRGHTMQVLTKRPERAVEFYKWVSQNSKDVPARGERWTREASFCVRAAEDRIDFRNDNARQLLCLASGKWPLPNVWLGTSVEDQETLKRAWKLLACPAAIRFLSCEPLLAHIDLDALELLCKTWRRGATIGTYLDWVIVGGESGPGARPFDVAWARSIIEQCRAAGVACFVKQLGAVVHWDGVQGGYLDGPRNCWPAAVLRREDVGGVWRVRLSSPKGGDMNEWPDDLCVREWPIREVVNANA